jgi:MFS family permease
VVTTPLAVIRRILRNRDLRRVFLASLAFTAAEFGTWVAILLYAYEATGPASIGLVALIQLVPASLAAPAAASLGDRFPRHRVLAVGYLVQAVAMSSTAAAMLGDAPVSLVYLLAAITATSLVVSRPTQSSLLPSLSRAPDELTAANASAGIVEGAGVLLGPLAAAAILVGSTPAMVFVVGSGALVVAVLLTIGLRPVADPVPTRALSDGSDGAAAVERFGVMDGLRTLVADQDARLVVGLLSARMLMIGAADVLFVLLALELLATGDSGAGVLAAALGGGAMVGGAVTFLIVGRTGLATVAGVGAAIWGLSMALVVLTASALVAPLLVISGGAGLAIVDVAGRTILQRSIRDEVLSRVFGIQEGLAMGGLALGSVLVPVLVGLLGLVPAALVTAATLPVLVVLVWPRLAALDRRTILPARELALLGRTVIFRPLPAPALEFVARHATWLTVPAGTVVIREGDPGDRYYVLAGGAIRVDQGGAHLRDLTTPGQGFGEIALLRDVPRTATCTATEESVLLAIDRGPFLTGLTGLPERVAEPG